MSNNILFIVEGDSAHKVNNVDRNSTVKMNLI